MEDTVGWCVHIHPVALFTVVDSYERRQESSKRVIGTLLGSREKGLVEIRSGYAVPHNETEEEVNLCNDQSCHCGRPLVACSPTLANMNVERFEFLLMTVVIEVQC